MKRNLLRRMMDHAVKHADAAWLRLDTAWVTFFTAMGMLNLYIATTSLKRFGSTSSCSVSWPDPGVYTLAEAFTLPSSSNRTNHYRGLNPCSTASSVPMSPTASHCAGRTSCTSRTPAADYRGGRLVLAGPIPRLTADPGDAGFTGSLIIARFACLEDASAWADADPYVALASMPRSPSNRSSRSFPISRPRVGQGVRGYAWDRITNHAAAWSPSSRHRGRRRAGHAADSGQRSMTLRSPICILRCSPTRPGVRRMMRKARLRCSMSWSIASWWPIPRRDGNLAAHPEVAAARGRTHPPDRTDLRAQSDAADQNQQKPGCANSLSRNIWQAAARNSKARHILLDSENAALEVIADASTKAPTSRHPRHRALDWPENKSVGGDLGWIFEPAAMVPSFRPRLKLADGAYSRHRSDTNSAGMSFCASEPHIAAPTSTAFARNWNAGSSRSRLSKAIDAIRNDARIEVQNLERPIETARALC